MRRALAILVLPLLFAACDDGSGDKEDNKSDPAGITVGATLPQAMQDVAYGAQLTATGGTAPYTYNWAAGFTPPAWLNLANDGRLTGTPNAAGSFSLQVHATDSSSPAREATRVLNLSVVASAGITTGSLPRAIKGTAYSHQLTHDSTVPVTFATASALPNGISMTSGGLISGTPTEAGLFEFTVELLFGTAVADSYLPDLVVYESIPYTYVEDSLEPNDTRATGTQLFAGNTPAGRMTMADRHVQAAPLTVNSDQNITKPDPDDYFRFNTGTVGEIKIEVFFRHLVGEVDAYLWYYTGPPTHAVIVVASSTRVNADDELIVYPNAQPGFYYLQVNAPGDAGAGLWNRNAYNFRVTFNDLTITSDLLEADASNGGSINQQVTALNQGASPTAPVWSLVQGTLPNGVSFTTDGRFTGTPTELGLRSFTVRCEDGGITAERDIRVRFYDSVVGDYWRIKGNRRLYNGTTNPVWETWGDAMVVAPHPDYPTEGAIYVMGGHDNQGITMTRVFHTDRAGIPAAKQFKFESIGQDLPVAVRYHAATFVQHSYGGYIYVVGGEVGASAGGHTSGDFYNEVYRLQVADGTGAALMHPLAAGWQQIASLPDSDGASLAIQGWGEGGAAVTDAANDADDRIYFVGGRYALEDSAGAGTFTKKFHNEVLMLECPTSALGTGNWHIKTDASPYMPRRFPAVAMLSGRIYIAAGRGGAVGQTGSGGTILGTIEMYQPDPANSNPALATADSSQFPTIATGGGYYPMYATLNGSLYVWCGWDGSFVGTKELHRFTPGGAGTGGTLTRLCDADWGTGFGGGVAHDGKLWIISGIGHGAESLPKNVAYHP